MTINQLFTSFQWIRTWPSCIYILKMATEWYNNMRIGFPTLENIGLDIKIILMLQLELKLLRILISVINVGHLRFSRGYGLWIKCIIIDLNSAYL